mgnify:CR=1 FL=1
MEECPARFIDRALQDLAAGLEQALAAARLDYERVERYATPRRLAVIVHGLSQRQRDLEAEVKGPPVRIAFDSEGRPTKAALGFAASQGVSVDHLVRKSIEGGEYLFAVRREAGRPAGAVLGELLAQVVKALRFPKSMRWTDEGTRFARPIRWLVALLGEEVVDVEVAGVRSDRVTYGHRFLAPQPIELKSAAEYVDVLAARGWVLVDVEERKARIREGVTALGRQAGGDVVIDDELLAEVTHLVEYPTPLLGSFDRRYLELPSEILVTTMREHQKYFPVRGENGALLPAFVAVRNGGTEGLELVRAGNERVLAARLADAQFFYTEDRKRPLAQRVEELRAVLFQEQLGSVWEKVERVRSVVRAVVQGKEGLEGRVAAVADRAAYLAKADLVTHVVYEFPELQGVMGREYALASGEEPEVAEAIFEHYLPRFAGDELPRTLPGALVALADKMDTIVGCFAIGLVPTGSADPYALRRAALGIIRILRRHRPPFTLGELLAASLAAYRGRLHIDEPVKARVLDFFQARARNLFEEEGFRYDLVDAALALGVEDLVAAEARLAALVAAGETPAFDAALAAHTRAANLAAKYEGDGAVDPSLFQHEAERALYERVQEAEREIDALASAQRYREALEAAATLKEPLDAFFAGVMVMVDEDAVRTNRLALLARVVRALRKVAAWERVAPPGD